MAPGDWLARGRGRVGRRWWRAWPWLARASGGNCSTRGATRRRHAVAVRLVVQNPPLGDGAWAGERWLGGQATGRGRAGEVAVGWGALWLGVVRRWRPRGPDGVATSGGVGGPSLVAGEVVVGAGEWGELQH